ncbi:1-acyl-sn-glycerol-3-phosphate acyltransferase [Thalassovita sp.]|uniref:1-acyl-sn-glycerol-3-phosphate acyltransferase n=1 Tax=Thalassovita sp. TaxID=1979401 RepID=UPI002AB1BA1E|nr:1-acyl-sn-glycerol-3-phosphate acyltransferase [Thalassovita sp.]
MTRSVEMPLWALVLLVGFAAVTFASHFLFPSVRWFFRKRMERLVAQLNTRLSRPIEPFKLARRYDMIERLIYDPEVSQAVSDYAKDQKIPEAVAFEKARGYAREIVPAFSAWTYFRFGSRIAELLGRSFYRVRVLNKDLQKIEEIDKDATVVLVSNHRSNMDYVLLTFLASRNGALSYAVGEWARGWPLGPLVRAMGAYFIRRRDGNDLYRVVLATFVRQATQAGVSQAVFPEGRLSLDAKLAPPKLGILKYIFDAHQEGGREVVFVPVAMNYDRLLEDQVLIAAQTKGKGKFRVKLRRALWGTLKIWWLGRQERRRRYGSAAVRFGQPVALSQFTGEVEDLAEGLMAQISRDMPVLPVPLIAHLLLEDGGPVEMTALEIRLEKAMKRLPEGNIYLPRRRTSLAVQQSIALLEGRGVVTVEADKVTIVEEKHDILVFYAASIAHLFRDRSEDPPDNAATAGS